MAGPDPQRLAVVYRAQQDLGWFGQHCLKVRAKSGELVPFELNDSQRVLHAIMERQREEKGWVRVIILKGRQQGISTFLAARFYQRTALNRGVNTYILSHEQSASDNLFGIVDRFQRHNPLKPHVGTSNVKELEFDRLESSYVVATAGNKAGGRSRTVTCFHGSEVAFWLNARDHFASSIQAVPLMAGTEIALESTSAGASGEFYERYCEAEAGEGDYEAVFLPWWLAKEYSREPPPGFTLSDEAPAEGELSEQEYADVFKVSLAQMAWRRAKISELRSLLLFKREYPADTAEAWTPPLDHTPFIAAAMVLRARKRTGSGYGPLILGVDPASNGGDRFSIAARRGHVVEWVRHRGRVNHEEGVAWVKSLIDELRPVRVNIDAGNIGANIITSLKNIGPKYADIVRGINFGGTSQSKLAKPQVPGPKNRRAEMWQRLHEWLLSPEGAVLPDESAIQTDITAPKLKPQPNNDFLLESKADMARRGVKSPDLADAIALTFASVEYFPTFHQPDVPVGFGHIDKPTPAVHYPPPSAPVPDVPYGPTGWMS